VHPTQLYEAIALVPIALLLQRWRAQEQPDRFVFGAYLALAGAARFLVELVRVNEPVLGMFTVAGLSAMAAVVIGVAMTVIERSRHR
jgi:phosphatidylglycerol:prolipoprotein diacylglycerol transferase